MEGLAHGDYVKVLKTGRVGTIEHIWPLDDVLYDVEFEDGSVSAFRSGEIVRDETVLDDIHTGPPFSFECKWWPQLRVVTDGQAKVLWVILAPTRRKAFLFEVSLNKQDWAGRELVRRCNWYNVSAE